MLDLETVDHTRWLSQVDSDLSVVLVDHAHCEKKAASTAMSLLFAYIEQPEVVRAMRDIVEEELGHLLLVMNQLEKRGIPFRKLSPASYASRLAEIGRSGEPDRAVDRLLIGGLIEARSCERFTLLAERVQDRELSALYADLVASESRHHAAYFRLAKLYAPPDVVSRRAKELAVFEAGVLSASSDPPRMHS